MDEHLNRHCLSPVPELSLNSNTSFTLLYLQDDTHDPSSQNMELSIEDPAPGEVHPEIQPVIFQLIENGTKRRKTSLINRLGFATTIPSDLGTQH